MHSCALAQDGYVALSDASMKCTKVPGTLARTYANEHMCIACVALEGRVTLAKMAENSLKF